MNLTWQRPLLALTAAISFSAAATHSDAEAHDSNLWQYEVVAADIEFPWAIVILPNDDYLISSRSGALWHIKSTDEQMTNVLPELANLWVDGQAGLFDLALHPHFASEPYVYFTYACGDLRNNNTCLARARWTGSELVDTELLFQAYPEKRGSAHYGGRLAFQPDDTLVLTLGDGFDYRERAQSLSDHLGTTIRLSLDGDIPTDNPFVANSRALPEIYSYGHRNVQGIAWHPQLQTLFISEHGPRGGDEINRLRAGGNFGWPLLTAGVDYTGAKITPYRDLPGLIQADFEWTPSIAPSGLAIYSGAEFPQWQDHLLVPALAGKHVALLRADEDSVEPVAKLFTDLDARIRAVQVHPRNGHIYLLIDAADGKVIKVTRQ